MFNCSPNFLGKSGKLFDEICQNKIFKMLRELKMLLLKRRMQFWQLCEWIVAHTIISTKFAVFS